MRLQDRGLIINRRVFGDSDLLLWIFSHQYGIIHGLVKKPHIKKQSAVYQIGNLINFIWQGKLSSQLGTVWAELEKNYAFALAHNRSTLYAMTSLCSLLSVVFPQRQAQDDMYDASILLLSRLQSAAVHQCLQDYFWWEIKLLQISGYGLSYQCCIVTGSTTDLCYMSPKTAAVVTRQVGEPYASLLLPVPSFLWDTKRQPTVMDLQLAYHLTTYFLHKHFPAVQHNLSRQILINDILPDLLS